MGIDNIKYFDLSILLNQDDLSVQKYAEYALAVTVDEYFRKLSEFLLLVPFVMKALDKFTDSEGDKMSYKSIAKMIHLLHGIRCDKFTFAFRSILDTYGKVGNWQEASVLAKRIKEDFNEFSQCISAAQMKKSPDSMPDVTVTLNEWIRRLDDEDKEAKRKLTIMAVDDSPVILKSISFVLSNEYKVVTLVKPKELERVLQRLTPDLFLLDYKMPELSGFDLIPIIRKFDAHKETPIIFLTSERTVDTVTAAIALGACDFAVKPFQPGVLREKIAKHIVKK